MDGTPGLRSGTFAGRYAIERELGRGATATVYLARDIQRGHAVAIKVLRPELAESLGAERFLREIKVSERLHHPHIASVMDSGQYEGQLYFVLPHMEGGSLRQRLQREKQLPVQAAVSITKTIALALDYAHREGLIHRDVKPENVLFTSGQACLADFGIARAIERAIDETTTSTGLVRGTPAYMSPEQASGNTVYDGRSDQYSLACVLYEMLAGVPAFIGATPEAIIAMRFQHAPRDVRVYRPLVSPALASVIDKALALSPADRYETMADFASAMDAALKAPSPMVEPRTSGPTMGMTRSRRWALLGAGVVAVGLVAAVSTGVRRMWNRVDVPLDTTSYFLLPVEADTPAEGNQLYDAMLQMMARWRGVSVVDRFTARSALGRDTIGVSERRAASAARAVRAGRYVRSRVMRTPTESRLYGAVFETMDGTRLYDVSVPLPPFRSGGDSAVATLVDHLLLRASPPAVARMTRVLPAVELYVAASDARAAFDLRRADSLLLAALDADRDFAQAALALAEVRAWREQPPAEWLPWVQRALASHRLSPDDRDLANALSEMAHGGEASRGAAGERSCVEYRRLAARRPRDIGAWFGFATCLRSDDRVVRDARSPSGWRFRSSGQEAVNAYVHAFALAPALHRTFRSGGYDRLRRLFHTGTWMLRPGIAPAPDSMRFFAYATLGGDTLEFVPYPADLVTPVTRVPIDGTARQLAVRRQREVFRRVARTWAVALPTNPGAKELMAISLEMFGNPAALDTIQAARRLAESGDADAAGAGGGRPNDRVRLAAEEVLIRVSLARQDATQLSQAHSLAESLFRDTGAPSAEDAAILAPIAAMLGRCRLAGQLAALSANPAHAAILQVPYRAYADAESLSVFAALGCGAPSDTSGAASITAILRQAAPTLPASARLQREHAMLGRALRLAPHPDEALLARFASSDRLLAARLALLRGDTTRARTAVGAQLERIQGDLADQSPDAAFAEALLFAEMGDHAAALRILDPVLRRTSWLELMLERPVSAAALVRAAALRADIASATRDPAAARAWSAFPAALWVHADAELRPEAARMQNITSFR